MRFSSMASHGRQGEKYMTEYVADEHTLEFVGPHALRSASSTRRSLVSPTNLVGCSPTSLYLTKAVPSEQVRLVGSGHHRHGHAHRRGLLAEA